MRTTGPDEDAALMVRFVDSRDRRVFEKLFARYRRPIVAYAGRYTKDAAQAEELAQEVFIRVYRTKSYSADAKFKTWLYRVATNVCLNELRRAEHKQKMESMDVTTEDGRPRELVAPDAHSPDAQLDGQQLAQRLQSVLQKLPEKQRSAFVLHRQQGLSHSEVAEALSTSVSAVKSLIHRALEALRKEASAVTQEPSAKVGA